MVCHLVKKSDAQSMWRRIKIVKIFPAQSAQRVLHKIFLAAVLVICGMVATAAACPQGKRAAQASIPDHKIERVLLKFKETVSSGQIKIAVNLNRQASGSCCGNGCHSHGVACSSGCCFAGTAAPNFLSSSVFLPLQSVLLLAFDQIEAAAARPPPELHPPRHIS
jgi:hypothetical protein